MEGGCNYRGVSESQDGRFGNKMKKLIKKTTFPEHMSKKVDMEKVNLEVIKEWMTNKITEVLGFEDEVVVNFAFNSLEERVGFLFTVITQSSTQMPRQCRSH